MSESSPPAHGPSGGRSLAAALAVASVVVACLAVALIGTALHGQPATPKPRTPVSVTGSVCGLPGFDRSDTLRSAPASRWQLVGLMAAPTDRTGSGPGRVAADGFRSCYAHTTEGVLYAVANYAALDTDPRLAAQIPAQLLAPGPGRTVQLNATPDAAGSAFRYQIAGFAIRDYTAARATVDLAVTSSEGELLSLPVEMAWVSGDWKVVTLPDGNLPYDSAALSDLSGYIPWSGA